ncbi:MAG TPA: cysteine hydrolase family protein [Gemmatimonadales bacterium]|nr:cysteine hydrolase family protein [Gemmatimonadales bacterium]
MSDTIFWDVDTQADFMHADGKLYVPGAEEIIPTLAALTGYAHGRGLRILASADDHVPGHRELSDTPDWRTTFPPHCMRGTPGQRKIPETALRDPLVVEPDAPATILDAVRAHQGDLLIHKHWFDVFTNPHVPAIVELLRPGRIVLYGVATDVCDKYAVEGLLARAPWAELWFVADAARAIHADGVDALLEEWRRRGVRMITARDILAGLAG